MPTFVEILKQLRGEVWWIGQFSNNYFFKYLYLIDLDNVRKINILTSYANIDKDFIYNLSAFWSLCQDKIISEQIDINVKTFLQIDQPANNDEIFLFDSNRGWKINSILDNPDDYVQLTAQNIRTRSNQYRNALQFTGLDNIFRLRIEREYALSSRNIPQSIKDELGDAILFYYKNSPSTGAFELIRIYEKYIRAAIKFLLSRRARVNWYRNYIDAHLTPGERGRVQRNFLKDPLKTENDVLKVSNPLKYFDCSQYPTIIERIQQHHGTLLSSIPQDLLIRMKRIPDYRNPVFHNRDTFYRDAIPLIIHILVSLQAIEDLEKFV